MIIPRSKEKTAYDLVPLRAMALSVQAELLSCTMARVAKAPKWRSISLRSPSASFWPRVPRNIYLLYEFCAGGRKCCDTADRMARGAKGRSSTTMTFLTKNITIFGSKFTMKKHTREKFGDHFPLWSSKSCKPKEIPGFPANFALIAPGVIAACECPGPAGFCA